jgi:S-DNA-T family DNA segregation ATPase FtsK/SpoIIIE
MIAPTPVECFVEEGPGSCSPVPPAESGVIVPEVSERADTAQKHKTTLPRITGGYKLPPSSLLHRSDGQQAVDTEELKLLAQVLTAKTFAWP